MSLEVDPQYVKTGMWVNMDGGPVLGKTITTDTQTGNLVVALLAVLSTLGMVLQNQTFEKPLTLSATAHLWHLIAFAIHQVRANGRPADAMFRQQQAMLRTLPTPSSVVAEAVKLWWVWRKKTERPFLRSLLLVLIAIAFTSVTIAASIFSSLIVDTGVIDVLVDSPLCGGATVNTTAIRTYVTALHATAPTYAQECYGNGSLPATCDTFTQPSIPLKTENIPCPFNETMCNTEDSIRVDSGLIDVGKAFGLNLAAKDRVRHRKQIECSVLPIEGYWDVVPLEIATPLWPTYRAPFPEEEIFIAYYGPHSRAAPWSYVGYFVASNSSAFPSVPRGMAFWGQPDADIVPSWIPKEQFYPLTSPYGQHGDIFLKPVQPNSLLFQEPVDDPLYSAHKEVHLIDMSTNKTVTHYLADDPVRVVGCTQFFQYCHARESKAEYCTPMRATPHFELRDTEFPEANSMQRAVLQLLTMSDWLYQTQDIQSCKLSDQINQGNGNTVSLPKDFWKQEVLAWEQEHWAAMQIAVSRYAIGPKTIDPLADGFLLEPQTEGEKALCGVQKMKKSGQFVNINVFGLSFVFAFSILVAIIDITLLKFLIYLSRFRRALGPRIARWTQDGVWQLQRRAYEGEGHREWTDLESEIPLMEKGHKLKDLSILWLPGKSPMMVQTTSFTSSNSSVSEQPPTYDGSVNSAEAIEENAGQRTGWYEFWRRR
ncbi:hypothetical protein DDE82_001446 [Stemphylium lycopersici]|nr:hypothetical protein DDE82_001446 [Stemphylium lycopersici]